MDPKEAVEDTLMGRGEYVYLAQTHSGSIDVLIRGVGRLGRWGVFVETGWHTVKHTLSDVSRGSHFLSIFECYWIS
jgi:hypothetical protein